MKLREIIKKRYFLTDEMLKTLKKEQVKVNNETPENLEIEVNADDRIEVDGFRLYSVSQIKKYMTCPYSYYLHYVKKLTDEKAFLGTITGRVFHKCRENNISADNLEIINKYFFEELENLEKKGVPLSLPEKGYKHKNMTDKEWEVHLIEQSVVDVQKFLKVSPKIDVLFSELEINLQLNNRPFIGYVDFGFADENGDLVIADYKTTYSFNYFNENSYKMQLALYCYAMKRNKAQLWVYSRHDDTTLKIFNYNFTNEEIQNYLDLINKIVFAIENEIFWKKDAKWQWDWRTKKMVVSDNWCDKVCPFKIHCFGEEPKFGD